MMNPVWKKQAVEDNTNEISQAEYGYYNKSVSSRNEWSISEKFDHYCLSAF
jgi:hypothetical protein